MGPKTYYSKLKHISVCPDDDAAAPGGAGAGAGGAGQGGGGQGPGHYGGQGEAALPGGHAQRGLALLQCGPYRASQSR